MVGDGDGVLEVGGAPAVDGDDGPAVVEHLGLGGPGVHHRLDGEHVALLELHAPPRGPVVGHLRILVHGGADPVAHVLAHDGEPGPLGDALDRGADVAEPVTLHHLVDRRLERPAGHLDEALRLVVDLADRHGHRGVGVPALDDRPAVDREDVALLRAPPSSLGMPCTITSLGEVHTTAGNPW